nr:hypothetical protein [Tanacetum cinerariifolium]
LAIRVLFDRPMRYKGLAMWDGGKTTWGGRVEAMGTVPVCVCTQEIWGEGMGVLAGKLGKGRMEEDVTAAKEINAAESEPTVFNDEEVTITMAQTLIKMKAKKAKLLDEHMAKRLHDEKVKQAAARERQEQDDFKRAQELQQQYDQKQENVDWNIVAEQMQEKRLDNIRKYQNLKRKPISVRPIFEREYNKVQTFLKPDRDEEPAKKRGAEETLLQESFKKLRGEVEVSVAEFKVEALQVKYPLIDWEIYSKGSRTYWKIIRVGGITQAF